MAQLQPDHSHRLAFIKHLLSAALDDARLPEPYSSKAILNLHDAVELFVQLVAETVGAAVSKKADFLDYWPALTATIGKEFPHQASMKRLNQARVGLKHSGIRPSRGEVDDLAAKTETFFDEASRLVFDTPFGLLSATSLVVYEPAAGRLRRAEELVALNDNAQAAQMCAVACAEGMSLFRSKTGDSWTRSPFPQLREMTRVSSIHMGMDWRTQNKALAKRLEQISAAFRDIEPVLLTLALGIEYRRYAKFMKLMPEVDAMMDGSYVVSEPQSGLNARDIMFSTDFVTQAALHLQELDPDPPAGGSPQAFSSEPFFTVMLPARGNVSERRVLGELAQIGRGWEAWIRRETTVVRIYRGENHEHAVGYLRNWKEQRIKQDGGTDLSAAEYAGGH